MLAAAVGCTTHPDVEGTERLQVRKASDDKRSCTTHPDVEGTERPCRPAHVPKEVTRCTTHPDVEGTERDDLVRDQEGRVLLHHSPRCRGD